MSNVPTFPSSETSRSSLRSTFIFLYLSMYCLVDNEPASLTYSPTCLISSYDASSRKGYFEFPSLDYELDFQRVGFFLDFTDSSFFNFGSSVTILNQAFPFFDILTYLYSELIYLEHPPVIISNTNGCVSIGSKSDPISEFKASNFFYCSQSSSHFYFC